MVYSTVESFQSDGIHVTTGKLEPTAEPMPSAATDAMAVVFDGVHFAFDDHVVLKDVSFSVPKGSMAILLGASGAGKSIVLKLILGLLCPDAGRILVNGERVDRMPERELLRVRADIGMSFQEIALFDSLTVRENVGYRLYEETDMDTSAVDRRVEEVLGFVGLAEFIDRMPSALSGGQRRRVAIARAMAAMTRRWSDVSRPPCAARNASPWRRKISATSSAGRMRSQLLGRNYLK